MKFSLFVIALCAGGFQSFCQAFPKPVLINDTSVLHLADPTIFYFDNAYYLYGTVEGNTDKGFLVYHSVDLQAWKLADENDGYALRKGESFGTNGFWAPQVFFDNGRFYMAYTANENIAIAESNSPRGPFTQINQEALKAPVKQIDPFVFIDDDGSKYLYHVRLKEGNRIFVARIADDYSAIEEETLVECITATQPWENDAKSSWPVTEGPTVLKRKGIYYLFYSANDFRNPSYAVGYATSNSPLGPWTKFAGNPVLDKKLVGINGTGHGDFFMNRRQLFYVFHTHNSDTKPTPRRTALIKARFFGRNKKDYEAIKIERKSFYFLKSQ